MTRDRLVHFLLNIPQSNQEALSLRQIAGNGITPDEISVLCGYMLVLHTLGMVDYDAAAGLVRARSQTAKYALTSLAAYVEADLRIIEDWKTRGIDSDMLANGASFLHALETQRLRLQDNPLPSRQERVAQVLIKRSNPETGVAELYFQYDSNAGRYQLIGGRWSPRDGDDMQRTMIREIEEELPNQPMVYGRDYDLSLLAADYSPPASLSPTFGALTKYHFHIYHLVQLKHELALQAGDRWISVADVKSGVVIGENGAVIPLGTEMYNAIDDLIPGGLVNLPDSFD
jgi:hypothetical protein